jgi:DNA-binding CsgD family transcriptional regulator
MTKIEDNLIGRQREQAELDRALAGIRQGRGGIILLAGEAGVGKTRLATGCLARSGLLTLVGPTGEMATPPYGPISGAIRAYLRYRPDGLANFGPLSQFLALLLPELGVPPNKGDRQTLFEAIRGAFEAIGQAEPVAVFLDDLQWADNATLELLPQLAKAFVTEPVLLIGTYRSDEIPRGHPFRRLRNDLRRARLLQEIMVEPLNQEETSGLAARILGQSPGPALAAALYERTEGLPLFVEEMAHALTTTGKLRHSHVGLELDSKAEMPLPDTLRDAVLLQLDGLAGPSLTLLEIASVIGQAFDLKLLIRLAGTDAGLDDLIERGLIVERESESGSAGFRHALTRETVYKDISWTQRRAFHRQVAAQLEEDAAHPSTIAIHWLAAQETDRARNTLVAACLVSAKVHAYQDAASAARQALYLWPEGVDEDQRLELLDQLGHCAQLCGMLAEASRAWRDVATGWLQKGEKEAWAEAERKLANVSELQGHWERTLAARASSAQGFSECGLPAEAAAERLAAAAHLRSAGHFNSALDLLRQAAVEANQAGRWDLKARILGLEGNVRARMGQTAAGLDLVREGLGLALEHNLAGPASEIYQRLADSLEHGGDYPGARNTYLTAFDFCQANALPSTAQLCIACLAFVLYQTGEWEKAMTLCRNVLASEDSTLHARAVAGGMLGTLFALRGQPARARPLLLDGLALARRIELAAMELLSEWGLAMVEEQNEAIEAATERCRSILTRWEQIEDRHYAISPLRWAVTFLAVTDNRAEARSAANALAKIASDTAQPEALSALAHGLGEIALLDGQPLQAVQLFRQSIELLHEIEIPFSYAATQYRAGVACAAANQPQAAGEQLLNAYRIARKLGARPLAALISNRQAAAEPLKLRLEEAAGRFQNRKLTTRQLEILRFIAQGQTTSQIAKELFLSPRTVEMHIGNIFTALDSRSRVEAVRKAAELGLLAN